MLEKRGKREKTIRREKQETENKGKKERG